MDAEIVNMGIISIIPAVIAIVLSFATRNTIVSLVVACIIGTLLSGQGLLGFQTLLKTSLGTTSFSWVMLLNISRKPVQSRASPRQFMTGI